MDLLVAQCSDIESLLGLARQETRAAEEQNFSELFRVAEDRATLGERLQIYHQQISELRTLLGPSVEHLFGGPVAKEAVRMAVEVQTIDKRTTVLLSEAKNQTRISIAGLDRNRRNFVAYLDSDARANGFNCDWRG